MQQGHEISFRRSQEACDSKKQLTEPLEGNRKSRSWLPTERGTRLWACQKNHLGPGVKFMRRQSSTLPKEEIPLGKQSIFQWAGKKRGEPPQLAVNQWSG